MNTTNRTIIGTSGGAVAVPRATNSPATLFGSPDPPNWAGHPATMETTAPRLQTANTRIETRTSPFVVGLTTTSRCFTRNALRWMIAPGFTACHY